MQGKHAQGKHAQGETVQGETVQGETARQAAPKRPSGGELAVSPSEVILCLPGYRHVSGGTVMISGPDGASSAATAACPAGAGGLRGERSTG
jgi:hypothetical protein